MRPSSTGLATGVDWPAGRVDPGVPYSCLHCGPVPGVAEVAGVGKGGPLPAEGPLRWLPSRLWSVFFGPRARPRGGRLRRRQTRSATAATSPRPSSRALPRRSACWPWSTTLRPRWPPQGGRQDRVPRGDQHRRPPRRRRRHRGHRRRRPLRHRSGARRGCRTSAPSTLQRLLDYAKRNGWVRGRRHAEHGRHLLAPGLRPDANWLASPSSSARRSTSIDIAMYSFSDCGHHHGADRCGGARRRGAVPVRDRERGSQAHRQRAAELEVRQARAERRRRALGEQDHAPQVHDRGRPARRGSTAADGACWSAAAATGRAAPARCYDENTLFLQGQHRAGAAHAARVRPPVGALARLRRRRVAHAGARPSSPSPTR